MENQIGCKMLYDWVSFTVRILHNSEEETFKIILDTLGIKFENFEAGPGAKGFRTRFWFEGINIFVGHETAGYIWVEMSGQGCRCYETFGANSFDDLLDWVVKSEYCNLTRLDIAFDCFEDKLKIDKILSDTLAGNYVSRMKSYSCSISNKGKSVVIGSKQSDVLIRIYDKAAERGFADRIWTRIELQLRRENATSFVETSGSVGERFQGVLLNYLRYVKPTDDTNKSRWPLRPYWKYVVGEANRIRIHETPGLEYNLQRSELYIFGQAAGAANCIIDCIGLKAFYEKLRRSRPKTTQYKYDYIAKVYNEADSKKHLFDHLEVEGLGIEPFKTE